MSYVYKQCCFKTPILLKIAPSILDNVKATIASITDIHDKDIEEVTETLCDVATRLNSIQNGRYWLQLVKSNYSKKKSSLGNKDPVDKYTLPDRNILEETKKAISTMTHNEGMVLCSLYLLFSLWGFFFSLWMVSYLVKVNFGIIAK